MLNVISELDGSFKEPYAGANDAPYHARKQKLLQ